MLRGYCKTLQKRSETDKICVFFAGGGGGGGGDKKHT